MIALLEAFVLGVLAAASVLYTFQTRVLYPKWMLQAYDKPWIFMIVFVVAIALIPVSTKIAVMLLLLLMALWMDGLIFARSTEQKPSNDALLSELPASMEVFPFDEPSKARSSDTVVGPSPSDVPLPEPIYPVFLGLNELPAGPAPF